LVTLLIKLSKKELNQIRSSACVGCGRTPPFADNERCHAHRIISGKEGGEYVRGNVEARCPACHDIEHGGDGYAPFIGAASFGGRKGGLISGPKTGAKNLIKARAALTRDILRRAGANSCRNLTPELRAAKSRAARKARAENLETARASARYMNAVLTIEQRRKGARNQPLEAKARASHNGMLSVNHARWHVKRGIVNPRCRRCDPRL